MDRKECEALLNTIDQMIETSLPRRGEYFRGYRRGIQFYVLGTLEETAQEHNRLCNGSDGDSGDQYLDAYAHGYRDGCRGSKPEGTS